MCWMTGGEVELVGSRVRRSRGRILYVGLEREVRSSEVVVSPGMRSRRTEERVMVAIFWAVLEGKSSSW